MIVKVSYQVKGILHESTNLQRIDVAINVQLTPISAITEYEWSYSLTIMEQQKKKIQKIYLNPQVKNL